MRVERLRGNVLRVTAHATELATLVAAARCAAGDGPVELPLEARERLRQVLTGYDHAVKGLSRAETPTT